MKYIRCTEAATNAVHWSLWILLERTASYSVAGEKRPHSYWPAD